MKKCEAICRRVIYAEILFIDKRRFYPCLNLPLGTELIEGAAL